MKEQEAMEAFEAECDQIAQEFTKEGLPLDARYDSYCARIWEDRYLPQLEKK